MKVIYGIGPDKRFFKNVVLVIGVFDGIHRGHQALIKRALKRAQALRGRAFILTFFPHPVQVLYPQEHLPWIIPLPLRLKLFERLGVFGCLVVKFTKKFSRLTPGQFIQKYLVQYIRPKEIFVGDDFRFGQHRSGTIDYFKEAGKRYGFKVNAMHSVAGNKFKKISSTTIRTLIARGKLKEASALLGRPVSLMGRVQRGDGRGKSLGFPTVNIYPPSYLNRRRVSAKQNPHNEVIPPPGVYAARVVIGNRKFLGMANVGYCPSFKNNNKRIAIEVHIFNFNKNLYGREIIVEFIKAIRREKCFPSREELISQFKKDEQKSRGILKISENIGGIKQIWQE